MADQSNTDYRRSSCQSGGGGLKSYRSQSSNAVEKVVKRINSQYERLMNDVAKYKMSKVRKSL